MAILNQVFVLIFLLALSGFFSGSEVALISLTKHKARQMVEHRKTGSVFIKRLKDDPQRMLSTILIGNNIVNVAASAITTSVMLDLFHNYAIGLATGIMTLLILVFGEITPKAIATHNNEAVSQIVAGPIWYLSKILAPILSVLNAFINQLMRLFGISTQDKKITEEEIMSMINAAEEEGSIKNIEKRMINNIFEFDDICVGEISTPRTDMISVDSRSTITHALNVVLRKKFSRMPVYEKSKDNIIGIVYVKDILRYAGKKSNLLVKKIMKKPLIVPSTKKISNMLNQFQRRKEHMAIVVDEHGLITGLVTLEDVLEEIVGEIMDESDKSETLIKSTGKKLWKVEGKIEIDELNQELKTKIKAKNYSTLSGFILHSAGKVPKKGYNLSLKGFNFKIEEMQGHRVTKVLIKKK